MKIEQAANAELHAVMGPYVQSSSIPGVTAFQHTSEQTVTRRGQNNFGNSGPIAITDQYMGESGSLTIEGEDGEAILAALLNGVAPASFVMDDPKVRYPLYLVSNAYDEDGTTPIAGHFVKYAKFENNPRPVGPDARTHNFQALLATVFHGKKVIIDTFDGNAVPVTALTLSQTAYQNPNNSTYALVVLRQTTGTKTVSVLALTTGYTETSTAITLVSGLTATEKATVIYVKN